MAVRELSWSVFICVAMVYYVDSIALHERSRWIALGDEIEDSGDGGAGGEVERYNVSIPVLTTTEFYYKTRNGKRINAIVAAASNMKGFVSLVNGGLNDDHVTVYYVTENGEEDVFYLFVESYKIEILLLDDNSAKTKTLTIVMDDIRNWTYEISQVIAEN